MLHDASPHARAISPRWWALAAIAAMLVIPMRPTAAQQQPPNGQNTPNVSNRSNVSNGPNVSNETQSESWVLVQDDDNSLTHGTSLDLAEAKRLRANASEPLMWFKRDGRAYVIRDRETLAKARALFIPQEKLHEAMHGLQERQTILGAQQTAVGETQQAMHEQIRVLNEKVKEAAAATQKTVAPPPHPSEDARLRVKEELRSLESRLGETEATQRDAAVHQEVLGMQQRALGEQQAALAAEQEVLSRQLEELQKAMEHEMRALFDSVLAAGIATPVK